MFGNQAGQATGNGMNGWQTFILTLIGCGPLVGLTGCTHSCWNSECDWAHVYHRDNIPLSLEFDAAEGVTATVPTVMDPATVVDTERTPFYLSLQEAFAMALESG